jgi:hypothetical protein
VERHRACVQRNLGELCAAIAADAVSDTGQAQPHARRSGECNLEALKGAPLVAVRKQRLSGTFAQLRHDFEWRFYNALLYYMLRIAGAKCRTGQRVKELWFIARIANRLNASSCAALPA